MNKYEKAFDIVDRMTLDEAIEHCKEKSKGNCKCAKEYEQLLQWLIDYKELKERATPMQPEFNHDEDTYECPCCGKTYETYYDGYLKNFCSDCGQALDWRVEDEKNT